MVKLNRMQLFYNPKIDIADKEVVFDRDESRHISKVLRKKIGDVLNVTNGKGNLFEAEITNLDKNKCTANIVTVQTEKPKTYQLHLAVAPTKMNDRYEWFLEKATEIGVNEITPIICEHSERKNIKPERFERILQSAMKQSLRFSLPKLNAATPFLDFVEMHKNEQLFIAHCEDGVEKKTLNKIIQPGKNVSVLIGPEGDFSKKEIGLALKNHFLPVSLGNNRLRTETAAIMACAAVAIKNM